jgi:hypothetical protein
MTGTATPAGHKPTATGGLGQRTSDIVSFLHAPEPTGCVHTRAGPNFITPPLVLFSSCNGHALRTACAAVSGLCTNPHSHFFFRYRCPLFWLHPPQPNAQSGQCSSHLDLIPPRRVVPPPLLSGPHHSRKNDTPGATHLRLCGETALTDETGIAPPLNVVIVYMRCEKFSHLVTADEHVTNSKKP